MQWFTHLNRCAPRILHLQQFNWIFFALASQSELTKLNKTLLGGKKNRVAIPLMNIHIYFYSWDFAFWSMWKFHFECCNRHKFWHDAESSKCFYCADAFRLLSFGSGSAFFCLLFRLLLASTIIVHEKQTHIDRIRMQFSIEFHAFSNAQREYVTSNDLSLSLLHSLFSGLVNKRLLKRNDGPHSNLYSYFT